MRHMKRMPFGVKRVHLGGKMRPTMGPVRRFAGGKMRWAGEPALHTVCRTATAQNPSAQNNLFVKDNVKDLTGSGIGDRLSREFKSYMGHHGSGGHHRKHHRSGMKGRGMHVY